MRGVPYRDQARVTSQSDAKKTSLSLQFWRIHRQSCENSHDRLDGVTGRSHLPAAATANGKEFSEGSS
jgi:hypothetical protein